MGVPYLHVGPLHPKPTHGQYNAGGCQRRQAMTIADGGLLYMA